MKKIIVWVFLALLLTSIIPVFAHGDEADVHEEAELDSSGSARIDQDRVLDTDVRVRQDTRIRTRVDSTGGEHTVLETRQELRHRFDEAKSKFEQSKRDYLSERENIKARIKQVKETCRISSSGEECTKIKDEVIRNDAKNYLLHTIDTLTEVLEKRKAKLNEFLADAELSDDARIRIESRLDTLDSKINILSDMKEQVESAETREEVKMLAKELRNEWKSIKNHLEVSRGDILSHKFSFVIKRSESLEAKLDRTLVKFEENGRDTGDLSLHVESFRSHIDNAKEFVVQARSKFDSATSSRNSAEESVKEGHALLVKAHNELNMAHSELKNIIVGIRASSGDSEVELLEDESAEEHNEAEVEDAVSP